MCEIFLTMVSIQIGRYAVPAEDLIELTVGSHPECVFFDFRHYFRRG